MPACVPPDRRSGFGSSTTSKAVRRAFDEAHSAEAGGSIPTWLVLTNLKAAAWRSQHDLAGAVGIEGPTLTRHLDGLEQRGLVQRRQDPDEPSCRRRRADRRGPRRPRRACSRS